MASLSGLRYPQDMLLPGGLVPAAIVRRMNRFAVEVEVQGRRLTAHLPNSGRLEELLAPGTPALLAPRPGRQRRTGFDLLLVRLGGAWVSADARLPNPLVREALAKGILEPLRGFTEVAAEVPFGRSRLDFLLEGPAGRCFLETKSVTLVQGGVALFPDAPTVRGVRHVEALMEARRHGMAVALFVVQREDAQAFAPHDAADPAFGRALRRAAREGVVVLACRCRVSPREIRIADLIPVHL